MDDFRNEVSERINALGNNPVLPQSAAEFMRASTAPKYCYNFAW
jgi:DNA-binding ferritin-like protein